MDWKNVLQGFSGYVTPPEKTDPTYDVINVCQ